MSEIEEGAREEGTAPADPDAAKGAAAEAPNGEEAAPAAPRLAALAALEDLDLLEEVWLDRIESVGPIDEFLEAIEVLTRGGNVDRAVTLVTLLAETLLDAGRHDDALRAVRPVITGARNAGEVAPLRPLVTRAFTGLHETEEWFPLFLRRSGLEGEGPLREGIETFESLLLYRPGSPLIHYGENRPARIESMDPGDGSSVIRFAGGDERRLSLDVTRELLGPLDPEDWRSRSMSDLEALRAEALEAPADIIRNVANARGGRATAAQIKTDLFAAVIPASRWNSWWKRAREEASRDPYLAVEGSRQRPVFVLRQRPLSLDEEAARQVRWARGLPEAIGRARLYREKGISPETQRDLVAEIARRIEKQRKSLEEESPGVLLEAALAIEGWGEAPPVESEPLLREGMEEAPDAGARSLGKLLQTVTSREGRTAALGRLRSLFPEAWADRLSAAAGWMAGAAVEEVVDFLAGAGETERLGAAFRGFLAKPFRHRDAVILLTRHWAKGPLAEQVGPVEILDALLPLARDLARPPRGEKLPPRLLRGLLTLLVGGRNPLIVRLLDGATTEDFVRWSAFADTAPDLPWEIAEAIRARAPMAESEGPPAPWEGRGIYCMRAGIARRKEQLRTLVEEKIPANRKALGEAASHGDLSENAEWQAAIEEQQSLADRARRMEEELARALPIEDHPRPEGIVCPGTSVVYCEEGTGAEKRVSILGPWDVGEEVVSYRAPIARGLLGRKAGEKAILSLPGGDVEVTIRGIELAS